MIIHLKGEDSYRALTLIEEIVEKYKDKHEHTFELYQFDPETLPHNVADLTASPLFVATRLIVLKRAALFPKNTQEQLSHYLERIPSTTIAVVWDCGKVEGAFEAVLGRAQKTFDVSRPNPDQLRSLAQKEMRQRNWQVDPQEVNAILESESDLWQAILRLKIAALGGTSVSTKEQRSDERFIYYRLFRQADKKAISAQIAQDFAAGKPLDLLIGELNGAIKKEVSYDLRIDYIDAVASIDFGRKTGELDDRDAVTFLATALAKDVVKPLQWERLWQEG